MNSWSAAVNITSRCGARAWFPASSPRVRLPGSRRPAESLRKGKRTECGDIVHLLQLAHHHLADHAARHLALAESEDALLDPVDRLVDVLGRHGPLVQRTHKAGAKLLAIVGDAIAARLHHHGHRKLDALVGREALPAG